MTFNSDRRHFLYSLPVLTLVPRALFAQSGRPSISIRGINHVGVMVGDLKRSVEFYQTLFGMPRGESTETIARLPIGSGPAHLELLATSGDAAPRIGHFCLGVDGFDVDRIANTLTDHGVSKADSLGPLGPLTMRITPRASGGFMVHVGDPDGLDIQLQ